LQYRRFGRTNLNLSVFSLGTMRGLGDRQQFVATVEKALAGGINHIETAAAYGESEVYLGELLTSFNRENIHLTSKVCPTENSAQFIQGLDRSLQRLQVDYLDCFAIHGINTSEHWQWVQQLWPAIDRAQKQGKFKHLGFSTHGSLPLVQEVIASGKFAFVNLHYYWFNQHLAPAIASAYGHDMGIFIISPADKGGQLYTPTVTLQNLCQPFTPLGLTYRFLLSDARITTLSLGPAIPQELDEPLSLGDRLEPLSEQEQRILQNLLDHQKQALGTDACHQCYQCLPCPEEINIPEILRLRNLAVAFDMQSFGQYRYQMLENAGHWFPGKKGDRCTDCGDCLPRCPHNLAIPELLRDTHQRLRGKSRRRLWQD
jgi:predicted aldo/keto reductase-like oxidoreductase